MRYLSCPKCKTPYSVSYYTITSNFTPVNSCSVCGWRDVKVCDFYDRFFAPTYIQQTWHLTLAYLDKIIPGIDATLARTLFKDNLSSNPDHATSWTGTKASFLIRGHVGYNFPYSAVEYGTPFPTTGTVQRHFTNRVSLFTDSYTMPLLFVVTNHVLALKLRYYSALMEGCPSQVFLLPRVTLKPLVFHRGLFMPERIITIGCSEKKKKLICDTMPTIPVFSYEGIPPDPLHSFVRAIEEEVYHISTHSNNTGECPLDVAKIRAAVESLDIPVCENTDVSLQQLRQQELLF